MSNHSLWWLTVSTPLWLSLCLLAACIALAWQLHLAVKRLNRHAESIAHMDEWADSVDQSLAQFEERSRRFLPSISAPRSTVDLKKWWQK